MSLVREPATHDIKGRPYAKLSELKAGDTIELDDGFTCHSPGLATVIELANGSKAFSCLEGIHDLSGQADDGEHCVGVYKV